MEQHNDDFLRRMQALLAPADYGAYLDALDEPPQRFARVNPRKTAPVPLLQAELGAFPLLPATARPGRGALHAAGAYYVQEPAAAAVANLIIPLLPRGARVLDMCAAPGGKVTAAAAAREDCSFLANEIVFSRAKILLGNVERLGLRNCVVTSLHPEEIALRGSDMFDAVIADVPCSGEGMLRKADFGKDDLSDESVAACAVRARKILDACDDCLRAGGILSFSTCTFNLRENEAQVAYLRQKGYEPIALPRPPHAREGFDLPQAVRFFPQDGGGEGHFCCILQKTADAHTGATRSSRSQKPTQTGGTARKRIAATLQRLSAIVSETYPQDRIALCGEGCELLPDDEFLCSFPALRRGVRLADFVGERILPHHHFATAAAPQHLLYAPDFAPDSPRIAAYLSGGEFPCDTPSGYRVLRVAGLPLGLVKVSDGIAKNHYPKGLRLPPRPSSAQ